MNIQIYISMDTYLWIDMFLKMRVYNSVERVGERERERGSLAKYNVCALFIAEFCDSEASEGSF